ncbi:TPA: bacteriophage abortive infection AbiH family protein [Vibrio parahaemolyticus]
MTNLYIIGNGFDLWHGLPTSYREFYEFAQETLDELGNYYLFDLSVHEPWHDFENALGAFDADGFFDFHNEVDITSDDFRPSFIYGLEDEITEQTDIHVSSVRETFTGWVNQLDVSAAEQKMTFPEDSQFITFNYTSTLQAVYGIEDNHVFHIHGRAETHDELIFGHGETIVEPAEFDEDGESTRDMFSDAQSGARYPLYALKKPLADVIEQHEWYFEQLSNIEEVVIIGHSLNTIEQPYFARIAQSVPEATWKVCCYSEDQEEIFTQSLIECGVNRDKIETIAYSDL